MAGGAVRIAGPDDLEAYAQLVSGAYEDIRGLGINFAAASAGHADALEHLRRNVAYVLVADQQLVATVSVRYPWGPNPGPFGLPHLGWIATAPSHRRRGLAQSLMTTVEEELRDRLHAPAVSLGTAEHHPWLTEMYTRLGYRPAGTTDLGRGHTTLYLTKQLAPAAIDSTTDTP
ncbi:GNAT family N-acetyltransferase [Georgenia sunbinii]|uniref:GNAT family N-acetyltransferase n=1 Tax=Georgenia sunbinii TaxID=3117728 RepID=UPI002F25FEFE